MVPPVTVDLTLTVELNCATAVVLTTRISPLESRARALQPFTPVCMDNPWLPKVVSGWPEELKRASAVWYG